MPNAPKFELLEFPKDVVEVYLKGGPAPALVVMKKQYGRAKPGWCERAVEWLEKNLQRGPDIAPTQRPIVLFHPGDVGHVGARGQNGPKPGAQQVEVIKTLNDGKVLHVKDPLTGKEHFMFWDSFIPRRIESPAQTPAPAPTA